MEKQYKKNKSTRKIKDAVVPAWCEPGKLNKGECEEPCLIDGGECARATDNLLFDNDLNNKVCITPVCKNPGKLKKLGKKKKEEPLVVANVNVEEMKEENKE